MRGNELERSQGWLRASGALALLLAAAAAAGCASAPWPFRTGPSPGAIAEEELREDVLAALSHFQSRVGNASEDISDRSTDTRVARSALLWKIRAVPMAQRAALSDDPRLAYARLLGVAILQRLYLTEGDGRAIFGEAQDRAVRAARAVERDLVELGGSFLPSEDVDELVASIEAEARRRPIVGRDFTMPLRNFGQVEAQGPLARMADRLLAVPMVPLRTLSGVSEGAAAIGEFNDTAIRFASIVERMPEQLRWQTELLLLEIESRETTRETLALAEELVARAGELSESVERMPEDARALLRESGATLELATAALREARAVAVPLRDAATQVARAGETWSALVDRDGKGPPPADGAGGGRPFDVREWQSALAEATRAASELRALASELRGLGEGEGPERAASGIASAFDRAEGGLRSVVDLAAWRLVQLALVVFVLALAYRLLVSRLAR